jgi:preprotein translocase subunit SecF
VLLHITRKTCSGLKIERIIVLAVIVVLGLLFLTGTIEIGGSGKDGIRVDTVYTTKVITIPGIKDTFYIDRPVAVKVYDSKLRKEFTDLKTENERLNKYLEDTKVRLYINKYTSNDSLVSIKATDSVRGTLLHQKIEFDIKERDIEYIEKTITKTLTHKPVFALSTGFSVKTAQENFDKSSLELNVGFRNKGGMSFVLGYDTNKNIRFGLRKDILTIYK